jgi:hypothetical protein
VGVVAVVPGPRIKQRDLSLGKKINKRRQICAASKNRVRQISLAPWINTLQLVRLERTQSITPETATGGRSCEMYNGSA